MLITDTSKIEITSSSVEVSSLWQPFHCYSIKVNINNLAQSTLTETFLTSPQCKWRSKNESFFNPLLKKPIHYHKSFCFCLFYKEHYFHSCLILSWNLFSCVLFPFPVIHLQDAKSTFLSPSASIFPSLLSQRLSSDSGEKEESVICCTEETCIAQHALYYFS